MKFFSILMGLFMSLNALSSSLVIFSDNNVKFYLFLDGTRINNVALTKIEVSNISLGEHRIQVKLYNSNIVPFDEQIVITEKDATYEYVVITNGARPIIKFYAAYSNLYLQDHSNNYTDNDNEQVSSDVVNIREQGQQQDNVRKSLKITNETGMQEKCISPISKQDLDNFLKKLQEKTFDDTKEIMVRQFIKTNCISSSQLVLILQHFDYEDTKLSVAKFAYSYIYDKNNYYLINSAFEYSSSVNKLNKYIRKIEKGKN